jgi:hypothetical protein
VLGEPGVPIVNRGSSVRRKQNRRHRGRLSARISRP